MLHKEYFEHKKQITDKFMQNMEFKNMQSEMLLKNIYICIILECVYVCISY